MKLSSYLDPKLIFTDIKVSSKEEAIKHILGKIAENDAKVRDMSQEVTRAVMAREGEISTCMGNGICIPHARIEGFDDFVIGIGVLSEPIRTKVAATNVEDDVKLFVVILSEVLRNKKMLKVMSGFAKIAVKNPSIIEKIKASSSANEIYSLIKDAEIEIDGKITAEDVLSPEVEIISPEDTLEKVAKKLIMEGVAGLPVVASDGRFLGEITEKELIEFGMPKYISVMQDVSFLTVGEPFEEYLKNEKTTTIEELYRSEGILTVDRRASIMEICFLMVNKGRTRIYVVEDGRYYGMICRSYIIKKVLHI